MQIRPITDRFAVGAQIAPGDVETLAAKGFTLIVSNRPDAEDPGQPDAAVISEAAAAAGLGFRHIPVAGGFAEAAVEAMSDALAEAEGPVFAFCRSGTRSTLLWALAQAAAGEDPDTLAAAAAQAGYDLAPVRGAMATLADRAPG